MWYDSGRRIRYFFDIAVKHHVSLRPSVPYPIQNVTVTLEVLWHPNGIIFMQQYFLATIGATKTQAKSEKETLSSSFSKTKSVILFSQARIIDCIEMAPRLSINVQYCGGWGAYQLGSKNLPERSLLSHCSLRNDSTTYHCSYSSLETNSCCPSFLF